MQNEMNGIHKSNIEYDLFEIIANEWILLPPNLFVKAWILIRTSIACTDLFQFIHTRVNIL